MNFLKSTHTYQHTSYNYSIENFIYNTKEQICDEFPQIISKRSHNLTFNEKHSLKRLKNLQQSIIIKPADKNL